MRKNPKKYAHRIYTDSLTKPMNAPNSKSDAKEIFALTNILKTVGASFPGAASAVEAKNQIETGRLKQRVTDAEMQLSQLEAKETPKHVNLNDWSQQISEYLLRTVDIAIVYDGAWPSNDETGIKKILSFGHGCLIGNNELITTTEVIEIAQKLGSPSDVHDKKSWHTLRNRVLRVCENH